MLILFCLVLKIRALSGRCCFDLPYFGFLLTLKFTSDAQSKVNSHDVKFFLYSMGNLFHIYFSH